MCARERNWTCGWMNSNSRLCLWLKLLLFAAASPPSFELNQVKKSIIVTKDREVLIECKPQGSPKPAISWRKGDKAVRGNKRWELYFAFQSFIIKINFFLLVCAVMDFSEIPSCMCSNMLQSQSPTNLYSMIPPLTHTPCLPPNSSSCWGQKSHLGGCKWRTWSIQVLQRSW